MEESVGDSKLRSEEEEKPPMAPSTKLTIKLEKNPENAINKGKEVVCSTRSSSEPTTSEENITCTLCNKPFSSVKALHGHMRCHPNRNWRGMNAPESSTSSRPITTSGWPAEFRRGRTCAVVGSCSSIKVDEDEDELVIGAACGLMLLATGDDRNEIPLPPKHDDYDNSRKRKNETGQKLMMTAMKSYTCSLCNKCFATPQALGGHTSSAHNNKLVVEDAAANDEEYSELQEGGVHVCKICDKAFPSGRALGGHMSAQDQVMRPALCLDLNENPAEDSEEGDLEYGDAS